MTVRHNPYLLLGSLLLMIVFTPVLESVAIGRNILDVFFCILTVAVILALDMRQNIQVLAVFFALSLLLVRLTDLIVIGESFLVTGYTLSLVLIVMAFFSLMKSILAAKFVSLNVIVDAISAYLLIGVAWAFIFLIVHTFVPTAFDFGEIDGYELWSKYLYLSFMTLTTLGYGDITSTNSIVQIWSVLESIVGVLFQAILIARLVSLYGSRV